MGLWSSKIIIKPTTGIPEDEVCNTLHYLISDPPGTGTIEDAVNSINDGINDLYQTIETFLSPNIASGNVHEVHYYDLEDDPPRVPKYIRSLSITPTSSIAMPAEVAVVSSFQAEKVSGLSQASRRNRIYLGPIAFDAIQANGFVNGPFLNAIEAAMTGFANRSGNVGGWTWVVHSPKLGTQAAVKSGWVDNEWDTQRRRGRKATIRQEWIEDAS